MLDERRGGTPFRKLPSVRNATKAITEHKYKRRQRLPSQVASRRSRKRARDKYQRDLDTLRSARMEKIGVECVKAQQLAERLVLESDTVWKLGSKELPSGRRVFSADETFGHWVALKQASSVIRRACLSRDKPRDRISAELNSALSRPYPFHIIKADIDSFYDSIDVSRILADLESDARIDSVTIGLVNKLIDGCRNVPEYGGGLPAGVSVSASLAHYHLQGFDREMSTMEGVIYYSRYVDDIVIAVESQISPQSILEAARLLLREMGLEFGQSKTEIYYGEDHGSRKTNKHPLQGNSLMFLGYQYQWEQGCLRVDITESREARILEKLQLTFSSWDAARMQRNGSKGSADGLLLNRLRFLAGNCHLRNSKSRVAVGVTFSNRSIDENSGSLVRLDAALQSEIANRSPGLTARMVSKLGSISFVEGYIDMHYWRFSPKDLSSITAVWKTGMRR